MQDHRVDESTRRGQLSTLLQTIARCKAIGDITRLCIKNDSIALEIASVRF